MPSISEVPALAREVLVSNVKDEENHDIALGYIANAYGVDPQAEKEALRLKTAWEAHPDHTITKALVAERAIFFVLLPFFRFNGDAGMRTVSADISGRTNPCGGQLTGTHRAGLQHQPLPGQAPQSYYQLGNATTRY